MKTKKYTKLFEWQEKVKSGMGKCEKCGLNDKRFLSVDHIIPVSFLVGLYLDTEIGERYLMYEDEENFQILCKYCNTQKRNFLDVRNPKTIPLLKKIIYFIETDKGDRLFK